MATREELQLIISAKNEATKEFTKVNSAIDGIKANLGKIGLAATAAGVGIAFIGKKFLDAAADYQQTEVAFTTMLGSAENAKQLLFDLAQFAAKTPFQLPEVEKGAKALLAFGFNTEEIIPTLKALGDVSAGLNVPIERLILNYGQVSAQSKLTGRELRDFAVAGVPLLEELANVLGKSKAEILDMVSDGAIGFPIVQQAFANMTEEGGRFFNLMDAQSKTFSGAVSNMQDQLSLFLREGGQPFIEIGTKIVNGIIKIIEKMNDWAKAHPALVKVIIIVTAVVSALLIVVGLLSLAFAALIPIAIALNVAMLPLAGIILGIMVAVVALTVVIVIAATNFDLIKSVLVGFGKTLLGVGKLIFAWAKQVADIFQNLGKIVKNVFTALWKGLTGDFEGAKNDLSNIFSLTLGGISAEFTDFQAEQANISADISEKWQKTKNQFGAVKDKVGQVVSEVKSLGDFAVDAGDTMEGAGTKGSDAAKKLEDAFKKLKTETDSLKKSINDTLGTIEEKISSLSEKLNTLLVGHAKENLALNQDFAKAYVDQEQKVADLQQQINEETDTTKRNLLQAQLDREKSVLDERKTIEIAFANEVNEVRRRNALTEFERTVEDLNIKRTVMNQEFQEKRDAIQKELDLEIRKASLLKELDEMVLQNTKAFLGKGELETVDSVNRQIEYYNKLAIAVQNARAGNTSAGISALEATVNAARLQIETPEDVAKKFEEGKNTEINVNITGTFMSEDAAKEMGNVMVGALAGQGLSL